VSPVHLVDQRIRELKALRGRIDREIQRLEQGDAGGRLREAEVAALTTRKPLPAPAPHPPSSAELRAWARERGIEVPERGRVRQEIRDLYYQAQREGA